MPVSNKSRQKRQCGQRPIGRSRGLAYSAALAALGLTSLGNQGNGKRLRRSRPAGGEHGTEVEGNRAERVRA